MKCSTKAKTGGPLSRLQGSHSLEKFLNLRGELLKSPEIPCKPLSLLHLSNVVALKVICNAFWLSKTETKS